MAEVTDLLAALGKSPGAFSADPNRSLRRLAPVSHDERMNRKLFVSRQQAQVHFDIQTPSRRFVMEIKTGIYRSSSGSGGSVKVLDRYLGMR